MNTRASLAFVVPSWSASTVPAPEPVAGDLYAAPSAKSSHGVRRLHRIPSGLYCAYTSVQVAELAAPWVIYATRRYWTSEWFTSFQEARLSDAVYFVTGLLPIALLLVEAGLWAAWNRRQWRRLPERRRAIGYRTMTPNQVSLRLLVPFYSLYWSFVLNGALCARIDEASSREGRGSAPTVLALICPLASLIHIMMYFIAREYIALYSIAVAYAVLWNLYMYRVERAWAEAKGTTSAIRRKRRGKDGRNAEERR